MEWEQVQMRPMGEPEPAHDFVAHVKAYGGSYQILEDVGCTVEETGTVGEGGYLEIRISYPPGTTRVFLFPTVICERYRVMLPNGSELREEMCRGTNSMCRIGKQENQPQEEEV